MKKLTFLLVLGGMFAFYACGPSAEEKAKAEQAKQDSIASVEAANKAAEEAASMQAMEAQKQDSIAKAQATADSLAKTSKKGKK